MKLFASLDLKTRAVAATGGILLLALVLNTGLNMYSAASKYRDAVVGKTTAYAEGIKKDIDKVTGFGLPLNAMDGMNEKLRDLMDNDADLSRSSILDQDGRILYASDKSLIGTLASDANGRRAAAATEPLVQEFETETGGVIEKVIPLAGPEGKKLGVLRIALKASAVNRQLKDLVLWSLLVVVISFAGATYLVKVFMERTITGPLVAMGHAASRLAAGDLSQQVPVSGQNEIAELGTAINSLSKSLQEMLGRVSLMTASLGDAMNIMNAATQKMSRGARVQHEAGEETAQTVNEMLASIKGVAENAAEMSAAASDASSSAAEMVVSIEEVAESAGGLSAAAEDTASSIVQTLASIRQVSENTEVLSASAEETSSSITQMSATVKAVEQKALESARLAERVARSASEQGMAAAREAMTGMENIRSTVEATAEMINRLGKRSQEIGQILKVIDEVTDQTSLLALNAAILAAQAGEHGRGFAVVAEEIRELADRTASSTKEIANVIAAVQKDTGASVQAMAKGIQAVENGVELVKVTSEVFEHVSDSSNQSAEMARAIELTTAEQTKGIAHIKDAAVNIAEQIEQIAGAMQEQRKGSERIALAAEKMRDITRQMKVATHEQTLGSKQIAKAVEAVTVQANQVAKSTSEQSTGAQMISDAITRIQKITEENVDVSVEMDMAEAALREKAGELQEEFKKFKV
ncbi:MAG: methyl-accepting chemotaxis protein [Nitrospirota bacterium]|nr:methyl-accepting chemotaxis protein [Nitrospirota bacterium]